MGKGKLLLLALAMALTSCGTAAETDDDVGGAAEPTSTSSTTTTSTTIASTTTTEPDPCEGEPLSIDQGGSTRLVPGCRYRTEEFLLLPIEFVVEDDGWLGFDIDDQRLVFVSLDTDADSETDADVAFLVWEPDGVTGEQLTTEALLAGINGIADVSVTTEPAPATVAGRSATTVDVEAGEDPFSTGFRACSTSGLDFSSDEPGFQLITVSRKGDIGFPACGRTRVWIVETGDQFFMILATPNNRDRFDEFIPIFENFLMNSVAFGDADG